MAKKAQQGDLGDDDNLIPLKKPQSIPNAEKTKIGDNVWIKVTSSNVHSIKFIPASSRGKAKGTPRGVLTQGGSDLGEGENLLLVRFWRRKKTQRHSRSRFIAKKMGPYYIYVGVSRAVWFNFVEAISKGGFVHLDLIEQYPTVGPI